MWSSGGQAHGVPGVTASGRLLRAGEHRGAVQSHQGEEWTLNHADTSGRRPSAVSAAPSWPLSARASAEAARPAGSPCVNSGGQIPALQVWRNTRTRPQVPSAPASGGALFKALQGDPLAPWRAPSLTVGSALANEVSVELVVNVDLHIIHPVNLRGEHRAGRGDRSLRHAPRSLHRQAGC